jgi:hypothetical protein
MVIPFDGTDAGPEVADSLVISNPPPVLDEVTLGPDPAFEGDTLTCTPGLVADDDGDSVTFTFAFSWEVAGWTRASAPRRSPRPGSTVTKPSPARRRPTTMTRTAAP